jgi:TfoX/Sxy family transcriptional regulator of competence genes
MPGRPMKGYATAPASLLADKPALSAWLERSFEAIAKMPAKEKKAPKEKA